MENQNEKEKNLPSCKDEFLFLNKFMLKKRTEMNEQAKSILKKYNAKSKTVLTEEQKLEILDNQAIKHLSNILNKLYKHNENKELVNFDDSEMFMMFKLRVFLMREHKSFLKQAILQKYNHNHYFTDDLNIIIQRLFALDSIENNRVKGKNKTLEKNFEDIIRTFQKSLGKNIGVVFDNDYFDARLFPTEILMLDKNIEKAYIDFSKRNPYIDKAVIAVKLFDESNLTDIKDSQIIIYENILLKLRRRYLEMKVEQPERNNKIRKKM